MKNQNLLKRSFFHLLLLLIVFSGVSLVAAYPPAVNERFALRSTRTLHSAEFTVFSTSGAGSFATLDSLAAVGLIDAALATGSKYGYVFSVSLQPATTFSPAGFVITATPRAYRKTGKTSFYLDVDGEMHGADNGGQPATANDPVYEECTRGSLSENETCTIQSIPRLHSAEFTYIATSGNGINYAGLAALRNAGLINSSLASGQLRGYSFAITTFAQTTNSSAGFRITAVPQTYGVTGIRSFFTDESGVIRGADKNGAPADENDPPI